MVIFSPFKALQKKFKCSCNQTQNTMEKHTKLQSTKTATTYG